MRTLLILGTLVCVGLRGQVTQSLPAVVGAGYTFPTPWVAPGQLVTLFVELGIGNSVTQTVRAPANANLPVTLGGLLAGFSQFIPSYSLPMLQVQAFLNCPINGIPYTCNEMAALTVQIPFEAQSILPQPPPPASTGGRPIIGVGLTSQNTASTSTPPMSIGVLSDQIHILTSCDPFISTALYAAVPTGFPCPQIVAHADGSAVSVANPAKAGEELVAYAVGLGQTNPASVTGQLVTQSAPTATTFTLDFNFRPNALGSRPLPNGPQPNYAGTTPGYVGLYQVNFVVPPVPAGTPPCVDASTLQPPFNVVQSNLTVSIGGQFSFDGARICVATN